jgi:hypothetical protein
MKTSTKSHTTESILASLGYSDPLAAAREHARMLLLGRLSRYQTAVKQLEDKWDCTLEDLRARYEVEGEEGFAADDDYLEWQWYADAIETVEAQLKAISTA